MDDHQLSSTLAHAARTIGQARTPVEIWQTIADTALLSIPGVQHVGVSVVDCRGLPETKAATSELAWELDKLQHTLQEGPCVESLRDAAVVEAPRLREDRRWPEYVPAAVERGLRAQLSVKLHLEGQGTVGGLNLYVTESDAIDPQAPDNAALFATHAALAAGTARQVGDLHEALQTRQVISQAVGLVMARERLTPEAAFDVLVSLSSRSGQKVREVAVQLIDEHIADVGQRAPSA